jgi:hypothetical protein
MSKLSVPQEKNTIVKNAWASMIYVIAKSRDKQMANVSTHQLKPLEYSSSKNFRLYIPVNKNSLTTIDIFQLKILVKC